MNISDFMGKELPAEVLEQLNVIGRVKYLLKPTTSSAISTAEDQLEVDDIKKVENDISGLIDEVKDFEDIIKELEDTADKLLKDMNIPPSNEQVAEACKQLGGTSITKPILDKALAIIDYTPIMSLGQDPFLSSLTGDGRITGPRMACSEMGPNIAKSLTLKTRTPYQAEQAISEQKVEQNFLWWEKLRDMFSDLILTLLFQKLWPMLVDLLLINPLRMTVANTVDGIIGFFKKEPRWRKKSKEWLKQHGPINKLLNQMRWLLFCKVPPYPGNKLWPTKKDYRPTDIADCNCNVSFLCAERGGAEGDYTFDGNIKTDQAIDHLFPEKEFDKDPCISEDEATDKVRMITPQSFGVSPECIEAAKTIVETVMSKSFTPPTFEE